MSLVVGGRFRRAGELSRPGSDPFDPAQPEVRAAPSMRAGRQRPAAVYAAIGVDVDAARHALEVFEEKWGQQLSVIGQAWRAASEHGAFTPPSLAQTQSTTQGPDQVDP
jgi:hypothetical protein